MTWGHALLIGLIFGAAELVLLGLRWLARWLIKRRKEDRG